MSLSNQRGSIGFIVVIILLFLITGVSIVVGKHFYLKSLTSPSGRITVPKAAVTWEKYTHQKFANTNNWSGFTIFYPSTWKLNVTKDEAAPSLILNLSTSNGDYIEIIQGSGDYSRCLFPDEEDYDSYDGVGTKYSKFNTQIHHSNKSIWRLQKNAESDEFTDTLCEQNQRKFGNKQYFTESTIGFTKIHVVSSASRYELYEIFAKIQLIN